MKLKLRRISLLMALAALLSLMTLHAAAEEEPLVKLSQEELTLTKGNTGMVRLVARDGATVTGANVTVDPEEIATAEYNDITGNITVTAVRGGKAEIKVVCTVSENGNQEEKRLSLALEVDAPVTRVEITQQDQILSKGNTFSFTAVFSPEDATDTKRVWTSSNPDVAGIDADGLVTAHNPGKTTINVTIDGVSAAQPRTVYVSGVTLKAPTGKFYVGKSLSLDYGIYGAAEDELAVWTSSDPTVAGVSGGNVYAYSPGETDITLTAGHYYETVTLKVEEDLADAIVTSLSAGENLSFSDILSDLNTRSRNKIGMSLEYISALSVDPSEGVLYFGYASPEAPGVGIGNIDRFYANPNSSQMGISEVTFVPNRSFGGTAVIHYVGYGGKGVPFSGRIRVTVPTSSDVSCSTTAGQVVFLSAEDFNTACRAKTGQSLRYVTFRPPAKAQGTLYQEYNTAGLYMPQVTATNKYYAYGSTMLIDKIAFVPAEGFTGTVSVPYTATDSSGTSYSGTVNIVVNPASGSGIDTWVEGAVRYTTTGEVVNFAGADFEQACLDANGKKLRHVSFTLPTAAEGKLYANYVSKAKPGTAVSENSSYTVKNLSTVSFVPAEGFAGTVTIPFTGLDVEGKVFSGTVVIRVLNYEVQVDYTTASLPVTFDPEDFRFSCVSALPKQLASVEFTDLPSAYAGRLLLDYKGFGEGTAVTRGTRYYYSGTPALGKITFVPAADYQGTIELPYTAYDSAGNSVDGVALIHVSRSYAKLEFSDLAGYTGAIPAIEFLKENGVIGGYSDGTFRPTAATSRAAYAAMVCRLFGFKAEVKGNPYPDVSRNSWCAETAAAARKYGVIYGDKNGRFNPTASVTKQQAVVMLQRAMEASGREIPAASTAILRNYRDSASVSDYAKAAMSNMIALGVVEADYYGYLKPDAPITRVEMATILYRLLVL